MASCPNSKSPVQAASCLLASPWDEEAVRRAAATCRERLGCRPDLVLAFASSDYRPHLSALLDAIRLEGRASRILGGSAGGLLGVGQEWENSSGLSLLFLSLPGASLETLHSAEDIVRSPLLDHNPNAFLALAHPLRCGVGGPLRGFNDHFPGVATVGGFVSGGPRDEDLFLFSERGIESTPFLAIGLGGNARIVPFVAQSCRPIGEPLVVTRSRANVVQAMGGRRPFHVLEETFASLDGALRLAAEGNIFAGLAAREEVDDFTTGDFVIRRIVGTDLDEGRLVLNSPARVGQTMQFQLRDATVAAAALTRHCREAVAAHGKPSALFVCAGRKRGRNLYGEPARDAAILGDELGAIPLAGFFGNGEFAPVGGTNFRHDHALCGAMFYGAE